MTNSKVESYVNALKAYVTGNINAYVNRANIGYTDPLAPAISSVVISDLFDLTFGPTVQINIDSVRSEEYDPQYHHSTITCSVNLVFNEMSPDTREVVALRMMDVMTDLFADSNTLGGTVLRCALTSIDKYSNPADGKCFLAGTVEIEFETSP